MFFEILRGKELRWGMNIRDIEIKDDLVKALDDFILMKSKVTNIVEMILSDTVEWEEGK